MKRLYSKTTGVKGRKFAIPTDGQWQLELPNMHAGEAASEQNGILNSPWHYVILLYG